jgi:hypothetical protein
LKRSLDENDRATSGTVDAVANLVREIASGVKSARRTA